ncbi:unnamed protein product [Oikopleura dioica]|uniref:Uncharacterized protein n=1 Tax=Oikopleura dioica TaxID=34765 RepID=E4WRY1_OIKDI|nr:unnamed protein product [Oikopleura dioica]
MNNCACGHYTISKEIIDLVLDRIASSWTSSPASFVLLIRLQRLHHTDHLFQNKFRSKFQCFSLSNIFFIRRFSNSGQFTPPKSQSLEKSISEERSFKY